MRTLLKLNSLILLLLLASCANSPYRHLTEQKGVALSALEYRPILSKSIYRCIVNGNVIFKKYHLSGILLFKKMENGTVRAVFQNEVGLTFFDFEWGDEGFKVNSIINKLNKQAIINILRRDFEMLLLLDLDKKFEKMYSDNRGKSVYNCFTIVGGSICYVFDDQILNRVEHIGKKSMITQLTVTGKSDKQSMPKSAYFDHKRANFTIQLTQINND